MKNTMDHDNTKTTRNRFTRMCIGDALLSLMEKQPLTEIRVADLVARAGISRMSYYNYYHSKTDVLKDYLQEIISDYINEIQQKKDIGTFFEYAHILHCLHFFDQYRSFFLTVVHAGLYSLIIDAVNSFMTTEILPQYPGSIYELYYYSGALLNTFLKWEENEKKESAEEIAEIISRFCTSSHPLPAKKTKAHTTPVL